MGGGVGADFVGWSGHTIYQRWHKTVEKMLTTNIRCARYNHM